MPENTIYVGRPTKWGNPFKIGFTIPAMSKEQKAQEAVEIYKQSLQMHINLIVDAKKELKGKNLACWCALNQPCHADILLQIANA